jgi:hypothetical protein
VVGGIYFNGSICRVFSTLWHQYFFSLTAHLHQHKEYKKMNKITFHKIDFNDYSKVEHNNWVRNKKAMGIIIPTAFF